MKEIILTSWKPGLNKVALSKLLRDDAGLSLGEAKQAVDALLDDESVVIAIESDECADSVLKKAIEFGALGTYKTCN